MHRNTPETLWTRYTVNEFGCWLYDRGLNVQGYGQMNVDGQHWTTHRLAWILTNGPIPPSLNVLHRCEHFYLLGDITSRRCINPEHLYLGTDRDNGQDRVRTGRVAKEERNGGAKLKRSEILIIRALHAAKTATPQEMADVVGVTRGEIYHILHRRSWTDI